jgi:eukaryotic-like serine/threonine-protein kinase
LPTSEAVLSFDHYRLLRQIGVGGSGKVYRAVIQPAGTLVAVKFMKRALLRRRELVERFVSEAKLVAQLRHPGIMRIHGVGRTPRGGYFLAMDLCERGDLQSRIAQGPVALADAMRWVTEAAAAMQYAHEQGVIHCDLKPGNLLIADDGRIVVSDFGLARSLGDSSGSFIAGTPAFLAPEQLDARWGAVGPRTDVYGLGAVLYTLLCGHPPRTGAVREILKAIAAGQEPEPLNKNVPGSVAEIVRSCLAEPDKRWGSVSELVERIGSLKLR